MGRKSVGALGAGVTETRAPGPGPPRELRVGGAGAGGGAGGAPWDPEPFPLASIRPARGRDLARRLWRAVSPPSAPPGQEPIPPASSVAGLLSFRTSTQNRCPASWASHPRRARDSVGGRCWGDGLGDSQHQGSAWGDGTGEAGIRGRHRAGHGGRGGGQPWTMALGAGMRDPERAQHRGRGWEGQHRSGCAH